MEIIGMGSYGVVHKAIWRKREVAVKTLHESSMDEKSLQDFKGEAIILGSMKPHTNVVLFLGITSPPQPLAIVTEFCAGGSLWHYIKSDVKITVADQYKIFTGVVCGMMHLHNENIIHRDLATRNVLLTNKFEMKVTDFGLSRYGKENEIQTTKSNVGPVKWMPPESIREKIYSFKSDSWSFGVFMWEVICRTEPWASLPAMDIAMKVCFENLRLVIPDNCEPLFSKLMKDCWSTDPEKRPSMKQLYEALTSQNTGIKKENYSSKKVSTQYAPISAALLHQ